MRKGGLQEANTDHRLFDVLVYLEKIIDKYLTKSQHHKTIVMITQNTKPMRKSSS